MTSVAIGPSEFFGVTLIENFPLLIFHRPAWGKRTAFGTEFPEQLQGWIPRLRVSFWGNWGLEELVEYARQEVERLLEVTCTPSS